MANPLFNALTGGFNGLLGQGGQTSASASQAPSSVSLGQQMNMQEAMAQLQSNPAQMIRQKGYNVPDEIVNNPQATVMHLIQSGQVGGPMMQRIQPMINMLMGKR